MFSCYGASGAVCRSHIQRAPATYSHMRRDLGKSFPGTQLKAQTAELRLALGMFHLVMAAWQGSEDGLGQPLDTLRQ